LGNTKRLYCSARLTIFLFASGFYAVSSVKSQTAGFSYPLNETGFYIAFGQLYNLKISFLLHLATLNVAKSSHYWYNIFVEITKNLKD
jgi:hypothetical protein